MGAKGAQRSMGTKATRRKILFTSHTTTILNPTLTLTPTPTLSLVLTLHLPLPLALTLTLIKTEYWDRAGGGGNIRYEW